MRVIKLLGLAMMAVLAMAAMSATSAFATGLPLFVTKSGSFPEPIKGTSLVLSELKTDGGTTVVCKVTLVLGTIITVDLFSVHFVFHECTQTVTNEPCTTTGSPKGLILTQLLHGLLGVLPNGKVGVALQEEGKGAAEFVCETFLGNITLKVTGGVIGEYTGEQNKFVKSFTFKFAEEAGKEGTQLWRELEYLHSIIKTDLLSTATGLQKFTNLLSAQKGEGAVEPAAGEGEIKLD